MQESCIKKDDLVRVFKNVGLHEADSMIVHSSYKSIGNVDGGPETVIDAMREAIGPRGNIMFPTFNYTRPPPEPFFDPSITPCKTGIINELGRKRGNAIRSLHPTHSVAVIGPDAETLTEKHLDFRACGIGSPVDRLAKMDGKVLLIGVGHVSNTMVHIGEEYADIPKASTYEEEPFFNVRLPDGKIIKHRLDSSPSCSSAFGAMELALRRANAITDQKLGTCKIQLMKAQDAIDQTVKIIAEKADVLLCTRAECRPCSCARENLRNEGRI